MERYTLSKRDPFWNSFTHLTSIVSIVVCSWFISCISQNRNTVEMIQQPTTLSDDVISRYCSKVVCGASMPIIPQETVDPYFPFSLNLGDLYLQFKPTTSVAQEVPHHQLVGNLWHPTSSAHRMYTTDLRSSQRRSACNTFVKTSAKFDYVSSWITSITPVATASRTTS